MQPHEISMEDFEQLILDGRRAAQYAWDHYEELAAREKTHTLYGPDAYGIGAGIPGGFISKRARKLSTKTRRQVFNVYELDSDYKLLRTIWIRDYTRIRGTYHCFELDGVQYAYPFNGDQKQLADYTADDEILAIRYEGDFPCFLGFLRRHSVLIEFFDLVSPGRVVVTTYSYTPRAKYTIHGYPVDFHAPIGALNSPVQRSCSEIDMRYTDFSQYFK